MNHPFYDRPTKKIFLVKLRYSDVSGPAEPVRPLRPWSDQKSCYLWSKPCDFSVLVGPIIVRLRFFSNGRTNLELLPPPLCLILLVLKRKCNLMINLSANLLSHKRKKWHVQMVFQNGDCNMT